MLINALSLPCMSDTARFVTLLVSDLREKNRLHTSLHSFSRPAKACMVYDGEQCSSLEEERRQLPARCHFSSCIAATFTRAGETSFQER